MTPKEKQKEKERLLREIYLEIFKSEKGGGENATTKCKSFNSDSC